MAIARHHSIVGLAGVVLSIGLPLQVQCASGDPEFAILERWHLGGPDGWDYLTLDSAGRRLFVSRGTRVEVVDTGSGKRIGTIAHTDGVHGIALAEDLKRGFTSNGKADSVTSFDLDTLKTLKEAPVQGHNPDAIVYDATGKHVFTFNGHSNDISVLDADTLAVVAKIAVPGKPEFAVNDGKGHLFANIESDPGKLVVIDSRQLTLNATWTLSGCANPTGLAIDLVHSRLFSVCDDNVMAITDAVSGKQIAKAKIGQDADAVAYDPRHGLVFSSNGGDGSLTIVRHKAPDQYPVVGTLPTMQGARTLALDASTGRVYLVSAELGAAPAPTPERPHPRRVPLPDTATVLVVGAR